ncbi:MAG: HlyD family efflux transporter periplasmic adaptor subunit [Amphritea sp.]
MKALLQKPYIFFVILILGIVTAVALVKNKPGVKHEDGGMPAKAVDVMSVRSINISPQVTAYGSVEPSVALQSKAEVSGKISYLHPLLRQGGSIPAGTVVVRIDQEDVQVSLHQSEADLRANQSSLVQLNEEEKTTRRSLKLSQDNERVGEKELARIQGLWVKRLVSRSAVDAEEQKVLQLRQSVIDLQGQLNTYASRRSSIEAQIERASEQVKGQVTTLGRTEIKMPFDARIGEVPVEQGEYVAVGTSLFESQAINSVEINAQLPTQQMRVLVSALVDQKINFQVEYSARILKSLNLQANVRLVGGASEAIWQARVLRFSEAVDPVRRTLGVVVDVDKPYEKIIPGKRPPLIKGMFTAVDIYAPERPALVIPRKALHEGRVYIANAEQRLEIRPVKVQFHQGNLVVIEAGLKEGEQLIINDLVPVIEGMPLLPKVNQTFELQLQQMASKPVVVGPADISSITDSGEPQ